MRRNRKSKPYNNKGRSKDERSFGRDERREAPRERDHGGSLNDISWYSRNPNLLLAAGSFPFPYRPGMQMGLGNVSSAGSGVTTPGTGAGNLDIPGVMALEWCPTVGYSKSATDPASVVAKEIYAQVRSKFVGNIDADAPDFVMYLMALDSIFAYIAWLKRVYRVMNAWTPENYALPDQVLGAMGFAANDIISLRTNRVRLWQSINELVLQTRKFTCPAVMDIFNRHYWMSDNVYTDEASINSQFYIFTPRALYQYAEVNMPNGDPAAGLQLVDLPQYPRVPEAITVDELYQYGRDMIDALVAWDDAYMINGYLLKAYEGTPNFIVDELPQDQPFNPVYVPEVLSQIENSRVIPMGWTSIDWSSMAVSQDVLTNAVISEPQYTVKLSGDSRNEVQSLAYSTSPTLSIRSDRPTVADSTIASRLQAAVTVSSQTDTEVTFNIVAGTEVPLSWRYVRTVFPSRDYGYGSPIAQTTGVVIRRQTGGQPDIIYPQNYFGSIQETLMMEQFDWHPFVFLYSITVPTSATDPTVLLNVLGDTHNITKISVDDLRNLHKICVYSEFNAFLA